MLDASFGDTRPVWSECKAASTRAFVRADLEPSYGTFAAAESAAAALSIAEKKTTITAQQHSVRAIASTSQRSGEKSVSDS
jgi:hypothetical protein